MKALSSSSQILDLLSYSFIRGGFFLRATDIIKMKRGKMFDDLYKHRVLWLKYHRTTCKGETTQGPDIGSFEEKASGIGFQEMDWINMKVV